MRRMEALQGVRMALSLNILHHWEVGGTEPEEAAAPRASLRKLNPPAKFLRGARAHNAAAYAVYVRGAREMVRRKLSPSEIVERLRAIDALAADGCPIAEALWLAGVLPAEYEKLRSE